METFALVLLFANFCVFFVLEVSVVRKASKLPDPPGYPPAEWDIFQRWVENKYFWWQLIIFLLIGTIISYMICV